MKTLIKSLCLAVLFCLNFNTLSAQGDAPTTYHSITYMKVAQGMHGDYLKLEKAWKKIHQANIKAGKYEFWALSRVLFPAGESCEYNYITRQSVSGKTKLAAFLEGSFMPENWKSLLTPEELALVNRTNEIRTRVKSEVWASMDGVYAEDMSNAKVFVVNYFNYPEGKNRRDHVKMERDIWKPIHKARVDAGDMKGWTLAGMRIPFGADMPYHDITIDAYTGIEQMLSPFFDKYFGKIHAEKNIDQLIKQTSSAATLVRGEVVMLVDNSN